MSLSPEPGFRGSEGFEQAELQRLRAMAETLVERGVGLVGCQKVVHPLLHQLLRRKVGWTGGGEDWMEGRVMERFSPSSLQSSEILLQSGMLSRLGNC